MNRLRVLLALAVLFQLSFVPTVLARPMSTIRHVAPGAACTSFLPCYASIQAAVDASDGGDVIEIATGVYTDVTSHGGVSQIAFISKTLTLRGGYNADFSVQDPQVYPTTLNAQALGRVLYIDGTGVPGSITVTLDGLQLTGGQWSASEYVAYNDVPAGGLSDSWWQAAPGGGVRVQSANVILLNSLLSGNHTPNGIGSGFFQHYGSLTLQNSTVQNNSGTGGTYGPLLGDMGGGLFLLQTTASINASFILNNSAGYGNANWSVDANGGGLFMNHSSVAIDHSIIQGNLASQNDNGRGGGLYSEFGSLTLSNSSILNNQAAQVHSYSQAGGAYLVPYSGGTSVLTGNLFQGNSDGAVVAYGSMTITRNLFQANSGGINLSGQGVFQNNSLVSNTAASGAGGTFNGSLSVTGNTFKGNTATGDGGGMVANGAINLTRNLFQNNISGGCGGGLLSNSLGLEDGDIFFNNTAWYGGGLCIKANNGGASYQNLVVLNNQGSVNGSGIYVDRHSASGAVNLRQLTIGLNTGGDGAGVSVNTGAVAFVNTILYSQAVGAQNVSGSPSFNYTLRYQVATPTVGPVSDQFAITGDPAFTADGYHLTRQSAAIDAGIAAAVTDDVDGGVRSLGLAPDLGAVESPYTLTMPEGVVASQQAGTPHWIMQWDPVSSAATFILQQDYLIRFSNGGPISSPALNSYSVQENFPAALQLTNQEATPVMNFTQVGSQLTWSSNTPLSPGSSGWVGILGQSIDSPPGLNLNSVGTLNYAFNTNQAYTLSLPVTSQVPAKPLLPPMLSSPFNGDMCTDELGRLEASGITLTGMLVRLYENGILAASTTADGSGKFSFQWTSTLTTSNSVNLYATVCDPAQPGNCSAPSTSIHLDYPSAFWCPQRSYWEGDVHNFHYVFHFVNELGHYATNDFELPGVYGFSGTQLHLYSCCDRETNPFTVKADGVTYPYSGHQGRMWTFTIGAAHDVTIQSQCQVGGGTPHGVVLIDPDGFTFDSTKGGQYDPLTGVFSPVFALAGITVTAYVYEPDWGNWVVWPAELYNNQVNPQVTGADGYFAFLTPPGKYYLQATSASGYQSWRSPVIQVTAQAVHANIPLTPWSSSQKAQVTLTPEGPSPATIVIPPGGTVEWVSSLANSLTLAQLESMTADPILRILSSLNPLTNILGFDGGMLAPGQIYLRQFDQAGTYTYSDGAGHSGQVIVDPNLGYFFLPVIQK